MVPISVKQMMAWPIAFGLSGAFFLGCLEALKHLPPKLSTNQHSSDHAEDHTQSAHEASDHAEIHSEKSHSNSHTESELKTTAGGADHHAGDETVEHHAKPADTKPTKPHNIKTH